MAWHRIRAVRVDIPALTSAKIITTPVLPTLIALAASGALSFRVHHAAIIFFRRDVVGRIVFRTRHRIYPHDGVCGRVSKSRLEFSPL